MSCPTATTNSSWSGRVLQPVGDLPLDPGRATAWGEAPRSCSGAVHRFGDLAPQIAGAQIGGVAEHPQRMQPAHASPDAVQAALNA